MRLRSYILVLRWRNYATLSTNILFFAKFLLKEGEYEIHNMIMDRCQIICLCSEVGTEGGCQKVF